MSDAEAAEVLTAGYVSRSPSDADTVSIAVPVPNAGESIAALEVEVPQVHLRDGSGLVACLQAEAAWLGDSVSEERTATPESAGRREPWPGEPRPRRTRL